MNHENSSSTQVWNDAVLLARERYEPNDLTVANDVPVPALDLENPGASRAERKDPAGDGGNEPTMDP